MPLTLLVHPIIDNEHIHATFERAPIIEEQAGALFPLYHHRLNMLFTTDAEQRQVHRRGLELTQSPRLIETFHVIALLPGTDEENIFGAIDGLRNLNFKEIHVFLDGGPDSYFIINPSLSPKQMLQTIRIFHRRTIVANGRFAKIFNKLFV